MAGTPSSVAARLMAEIGQWGASEGPRGAPGQAQELVEPLSARDLDGLRYLAVGRSNKEMGVERNIIEGTVKNYMTDVLGRIGCARPNAGGVAGAGAGVDLR